MLTGSSLGTLSGSFSTESAAVLKAKKAFTLPVTTPPWQEATSSTSVSSQVVAIKRMLSIVDSNNTDSSLEDLPDVQTTFTTYKALDRLRVLAEAAAKTSISAKERESLQTAFTKGLSDLQSFMNQAPTDLVTLAFGLPTRQAQSVAIKAPDYSGKVIGGGVVEVRADAIPGLSGSEVLKIDLSRSTSSESLTVDLSQTTQPPTLDSVADALNAAISASPTVWKSRFTVEKHDGEWGLVLNAAGAEKVALDQVGAKDALIVASGQTEKPLDDDASPITAAQIYRFDDPATSLQIKTLSTINAVDGTATELAQDKDSDAPAVLASTQARAIATDAQGFSYVVGTTAGDVGSNLSDGKDDLFLTKVDSEGKVVWQRSLGASGKAEGAAVSIAANGDVVVAGTVDGAFNGTSSTETDMMVARFSANGDEVFAKSIRQTGNETASAITVGDDGSIYVGGRSSTGSGDAFVVKLSATGNVQQRRSIDSGASDQVTALAIDGSGQLLALTKENGVATLHRIDSTSLSTDLGSISLGAADARAIAVSDSGEIAIAGATAAALSGTQVNGLSGGRDAFVTRIDAALSSASTTYIGSAADDQIDSVTFMGGDIYVGGRTSGVVGDKKAGKVDGFIAHVDSASGAVESISQFGLATRTTEPVKVSAATGGGSVLGALGLNRGTLNQTVATSISAQTSLREGDKFSLSVNGGSTRTITIAKGETMTSLADKIRKIAGTAATISTPKVNGATSLRINIKAGSSLELLSGPGSTDALPKLGLEPIRLSAPAPVPDDAPKVRPGGTFSLQLNKGLDISDAKTAAATLKTITSAISMTQTAYRSLYWDSAKAQAVDGAISGGGSAYQQAQLANYQAALDRLTTTSS
jgi:hypothetical protein